MNVSLSGEIGTALSVINSINRNDILLLSEPVLDIKNNNQYISKHVSIGVLSDSIINNIKNLQKFGSMAYVDKNDYSSIDHNHDDIYNKVTISTLYRDSENTVKIGTLTIDGQKNDIYVPKMKIKTIPAPLVGQLKFIHHTIRRDINIYSDDFDGWVYADGSEYDCELFPTAKDVFDNNGTTFTVPALNNFIKPNPFPYSGNNMSETYNHVDPLHSHRMLVNLSGNVNGQLQYGCNTNGKGNTSHGASNADKVHNYNIDLDYTTINVSSRSKDYIHTSGSDTDETYPTHNNIPVMIYIGLPKIYKENGYE